MLADVKVDDLDLTLRLYTIKQLAELWSVDRRTLERAIERGEMRTTHTRGRRKYIVHAEAARYLSTLSVDG